MRRREFIQLATATMAAAITGACTKPVENPADSTHLSSPSRLTDQLHPLDAAAYGAERRFATTPFGRIAYLERGTGDAALFLHGLPLNGFQWRGAIERLSSHRRCIAPDFMGLGYSEVPEQQSLAASAQVEMLVKLLDELGIGKVDIVANDSGGTVAQLFMAKYPARVRTVLLSNCDVEPNSPPAKVKPTIEKARAGILDDEIAEWLNDKDLTRTTFGAGVYSYPNRLADETIEYYFTPLVSSPLRRAQFNAYVVALTPNPLAGIEATLRRSTLPVRIVWGASDDIFLQSDADYLDRIFQNSRGVRRVPGARLFFPEEFPDLIAEEARTLWNV